MTEPERIEVPFELPARVSVTLTLYANVTLTQELCDGIADQYPDLWRESRDDPEALGRAVLYALVNPQIPGCAYKDDYWDGVASLDGLVENVELEG